MRKLNYKHIGLALIMLIDHDKRAFKNIAAFYNHIGLALYMLSGTAAYMIGLYFNDYLKEKEKENGQ